MFDKYLHYEIEDWLTDDDFIQYVNGEVNLMAPVMQHFKNDESVSNRIKEATTILKGIESSTIAVDDERIDKLFNKINNSIDHQSSTGRTAKLFTLKRIVWTSGIAAAIALLFFALPLINSQDLQQYATAIGERESVVLPDESIVEVNTLTSISFDSKDWENARAVNLKGEAFFKVEKGRKFSVVSENGTVSVLGTQFNIYDRNKKYEVECLEGKVSVALKSGEEYILNGGDKLSLDINGNINVERSTVDKIDWMNDFVELKNARLDDVLEEMGRYFNFEIESNQNLERFPYSGFFSTNSLDSAIYQVLWPLNIEYELQGNKLIIK